MSASEDQLTSWQDPHFLERLSSLEGRHQRIQSEHETVRRGLEGAKQLQTGDLRVAWRRYCEVIAELDQATADLEALRTRAG